MISTIVITFFLILFIIFFLYYLLAFWTGAPFLPTPPKIVGDMIRLADIKSGDAIADLGSGDGRILLAAAQKGANAVGWEINPVLFFWSQFKIIFSGLHKQVIIYCRDYRNADLKGIKKLFLYSIADKIKPIEKLILRDMQKGSLVISYKFSLPHLRLKYKTPSGIYVYTV